MYVAKMVQLTTVQRKLNTFSLFEISVTRFSENSKRACGANEIHGDTAMLLFLFFMKKTGSEAFSPRLRTECFNQEQPFR